MNWRDRIVLWVMRRLTPNGLCAQNEPMMLYFDSGLSTPDDPKLRMIGRHLFTGQTLIAIVWDPDTVVEDFAERVDGLRAWAEANR